MNEISSLVITTVPELIKSAIIYTVPLTIISFAIGLVLAVLVAMVRISKLEPFNTICRIYLSIIRGTPLIVQLFILFYGLPSIGIVLDSFLTAVIGFSLSVGAYCSEIVRSAILSVPRGQWNAADSLGLSAYQKFFLIIAPQAAKIATPALSNQVISLLKDTSLASTVLVAEMFRRAQEIAFANNEILLVYCCAAFVYWIFSTILANIQQRIEIKLRSEHH